MAFIISGSLAIDETDGTQNVADSSDNSGNDVAGGLATLVTHVPQFDALLAVVVGTGAEPSGVSVSNANADNSTGTPLLTALGSHVSDLAFTDSTGAPLDGDAAKYGTGADEYLRTTDGAKIFLYSYSGTDLPGVDENNAVFGREGVWDAGLNDWVADPTGTVVFAAYLQPTDSLGAAQATDASAAGAKVWLVEYEPILHPVAGASVASHDDSVSLVDPLYVSVAHQDQFSLAGAPSGQNLFMMYGDGTPSAEDTTIVVTGWHPADQSEGESITTGDTVNTGKGGGDTTIGSNNQMIDPNEGMYFTFVTGANTNDTVPNLSQTEADVEANIDFASYQGSLSASFDVVQLQPPKGATLMISAFDNTDATEKGTTYIDGLGDDDDDPVNVTEVIVTRMVKTGKTVEETSYTFSEGSNTPQGGLTLDFDGDTVVITGIKSGDHIEYTTSALHNRVLINNVGNETADLNAAFDIGGFSVGTNTIETTAFSALAFQDDGPSVAVSAADDSAVLLTTQDAQTDGDPTDSDSDVTSADFSGVFSNTPVYGADGAGSTVKSYAVNLYGADGVDSQLDSNGVSVLLYKVGDVVKGSTAATLAEITDGNTIFTIAVGTSTGVVTLTQYAEIDHALESETASPFDDQYAVLGAGLVKLTGSALATDGDGDTDSDGQDVDLGGNVRFADDGPSVTVSATGEEAVLLTTQDAQTDGDPTDSDSDVTTADFSGVFSNTPVYGADGAGTTVKSYAVNLYGANGTDSLLDSNGVSVLLYKVGDVIKGSTAASLAAITDGNTIFTIAVGTSTGVVTLTQYAEIDHALESETGSPFDDQYAVLGAGLVKLTGSALTTDGDGDTDSDSQDVDLGGNVRFADDGPTLSGVSDSTNSLVFDSSTAPFVDSFTFAPGADGAATPGVALVDYTDPDNSADLLTSGLGALETLLGKNVTASQSGNTVTYYTPDGADAGTELDPLFSLAVTDSNWTFTILQDAPLVFNNFNFGTLAAGGPQEILSLAATNSTTFGVFDGFLFGDIDAADGTEARGINPPTPINLPGSTVADTADDLNPDAHGFGVKGGAASNMNNNEGFSISFHEGSAAGDDTTVEGLRFSMDQQGNTDDVVMSFQLTDSGTMPDIVAIEKGSTISLLDSKSLTGADDGSFWVRMGLPIGNNDVFFTILSNEYKDFYTPEANELVVYVNGSYETAMFRMAYPDTGTYDQYPGQVGDSVRVKDVTLIETMPIPNVALEFSVQGTDGDGDTTQVETFDVFISEMGVPFAYPFV